MGSANDAIIFNHIPKIMAKLKAAEPKIVKKLAFEVEAIAKSNAPVQTGFLRNSIYTVTETTSGAAQSIKAGTRVQKFHGTIHNVTDLEAQMPFPPVEPTGEPGRALVVVGAKYGAYVELGTGRTPAQPFLLPAATEAFDEMVDQIKEFIDDEITKAVTK